MGSKAQVLIITIGVLASAGLNFWIIWYNEMAAGLFAPQDVFIFKIFVNKPYTKLYAVILGAAMALLYLSIAKYR